MGWTVKCSPDGNIVIVTNEGIMTAKDYQDQTVEALELARSNKTNLFLSDNRNAVNEASMMEIILLPAFFIHLGSDKKNKLAVILPESSYVKSAYTLFKKVCEKSGYQVMLYETEKEAVDWLVNN